MAPSAQIVGDMGRVALGLAIAGGNPYYAAGRNLVADIQAEADPVTGALDDAGSLYSEMLGIQALIASNAVLPAGTVDNLLAAQNEDGGWGWAVGQDSDSNTAALAVQTLIAAGVPGNDDVIVSAAVYLQSVQGSDGGFVYSPVWGDISDADSTGVALQAFQSLGVDTSAGWSFARTLQGADVISTTLTKPEQFLYGLQNADGSFNWQPGVPGFGEMSTLDALASLGDGPYVEPSASLASAHDAVAWLKTQQLADGSFPVGWGHAGGASLDVLFAGLAMGEEAGDWAVSVGDVTLIDYLSASAPEYATTAGAAGKLLCGAVAAGVDPRAFDETDLVATVRSFETTTGAFGDSLADQAWAMLGLAASGVPICPEALDQMAFAQNEDGGWGWMPGEDSDTNSTSMAIQALVAGGMARDHAEVVDALAFLAAQQLSDGGFPFMRGGAIDAASTGYVLQALIAVGESPFSEPWLVDGSSPVDALLALQLQEGAYPGWAGTADLMSTAQSVPGLLLETLPLRVGLYSVAQWLPFTSTAVAQ